MKLLVRFSIILLLSTNLAAEEAAYPILFSEKGTLHLKTCTTRIDCNFSGTQTLSGKYYFGFSEICDNDEKDGCVTLDFYPDDATVLPYFKGAQIKSINISNYKEGAEILMGEDLVKKVISSAQSAIATHIPDHDFNKTITARGNATIQIEDYEMGICCDSSYSKAKILQVRKKSKPEIEDPDNAKLSK